MIVVVTGNKPEVTRWALRHGLRPRDYIRVQTPSSLATFMPGTPYVTVGEWVWYNASQTNQRSEHRCQVRPYAYDMIVAAERAGLHLLSALAE